MKEEFKQLYDIIICSNDEHKMHVLGSVTKDMMQKFIEQNPQQAREYLDMLQSVKWKNYVTAREAEHVVDNMMPKPSFTRQQWDGMMLDENLPKFEEACYNEHALYLTMCMISSDSEKTLYNIIGGNEKAVNRTEIFHAIYKLALDKLKDQDGVFNIRSYFNL